MTNSKKYNRQELRTLLYRIVVMQGITVMVGHLPIINKSYGGNNSYGGPKG